MAIVCLILGIGLAIVSFRCRKDHDHFLPIFLLVFALGNLFGAWHMIATDFPYAFKLAPNHHPAD